MVICLVEVRSVGNQEWRWSAQRANLKFKQVIIYLQLDRFREHQIDVCSPFTSIKHNFGDFFHSTHNYMDAKSIAESHEDCFWSVFGMICWSFNSNSLSFIIIQSERHSMFDVLLLLINSRRYNLYWPLVPRTHY